MIRDLPQGKTHYCDDETLTYIFKLEERNARLLHHLKELSKFADLAAFVLATLEAENSDEEEQIQKIIDGISQWAPDALLGTVIKP